MSLDGVQSLPLPCSHGVVASFEAKRIMIIMIYDILRLTILSSHSLPKPGCMLVYYRFPKMPSMFHLYVKCDAQQVKPCLLFSHSPFLHIITYLQTHHDPAGKNVRTTVIGIFQVMGPVWNPGTLLFTPTRSEVWMSIPSEPGISMHFSVLRNPVDG